MNSTIHSILRYIRRKTYSLIRKNYPATILINFATLPFMQAISFPIHCYGKCKFHDLRGRIILDGPIRNGMIRIGYRWLDLWPVSYLPTQIRIGGNIVFKGNCIIGGGVSLAAQGSNSLIVLGHNVHICSGTIIKAMKRIEIGPQTSIGAANCIMDSNMHFIKEMDSGVIYPHTAPIVIGTHCWLNYGTVVSKGSIIPDYIISGRDTFFSGDYSEYEAGTMFVGAPAKPLKNKKQRIFNVSTEKRISIFFKENPDATEYSLKPGLEIDESADRLSDEY